MPDALYDDLPPGAEVVHDSAPVHGSVNKAVSVNAYDDLPPGAQVVSSSPTNKAGDITNNQYDDLPAGAKVLGGPTGLASQRLAKLKEPVPEMGFGESVVQGAKQSLSATKEALLGGWHAPDPGLELLTEKPRAFLQRDATPPTEASYGTGPGEVVRRGLDAVSAKASELGAGLLTPENIKIGAALPVAGPLATAAISSKFSADAVQGGIERARAMYADWDTMPLADKIQAGIGLVGDAAMATAMAGGGRAHVQKGMVPSRFSERQHPREKLTAPEAAERIETTRLAQEPQTIAAEPVVAESRFNRATPEAPTEQAPVRKVADWTDAEKTTALLKNDKTGLPNRRGFEEARNEVEHPYVAIADAKGLKYLNDKHSDAAGDALLKFHGDSLEQAARELGGGTVAHSHGDTYFLEAKTPELAEAIFDRAEQIRAGGKLAWEMADGSRIELPGAPFGLHRGVGRTLAEAGEALNARKTTAEQRVGERRGERPAGLDRQPTEGGPVGGDQPIAEPGPRGVEAPEPLRPAVEPEPGELAPARHTQQTIADLIERTPDAEPIEGSRFKRTFAETEAATQANIEPLTKRALAAKEGELLSPEVRSAGFKHLKKLVEEGRPEDLADVEHLARVLHEAGSELGRGLNFSKAMLEPLDITNGASVLDVAMKATKGKLSKQATLDLADLSRKASVKKKTIDEHLNKRAEAALARLENMDVGKVTVKDILSC